MYTGATSLRIESLEADDERLLYLSGTSFIFLRGAVGPFSLLTGWEEVFGRNRIRVKVAAVNVTDLLGKECLHCCEMVDDPSDMVLFMRSSTVDACLHEGCFRKWFVGADKGRLKPYRFLLVERLRLSSREACNKLLLPGAGPEQVVEVDCVKPLDFNQIRKADERSRAAVRRSRLKSDDRPGVNIFLCPRCTAPKEVHFLDTEDRIHECSECGARFKVLVKEV